MLTSVNDLLIVQPDHKDGDCFTVRVCKSYVSGQGLTIRLLGQLDGIFDTLFWIDVSPSTEAYTASAEEWYTTSDKIGVGQTDLNVKFLPCVKIWYEPTRLDCTETEE